MDLPNTFIWEEEVVNKVITEFHKKVTYPTLPDFSNSNFFYEHINDKFVPKSFSKINRKRLNYERNNKGK